MARFRVRIEERAVYDVIVDGVRTNDQAKEAGLEAFVQGYGDFIYNVDREVVQIVRHRDT